jgi:DNA-binding NtrC family response regulator
MNKPNSETLNVLVVDDEEKIRTGLVLSLQDQGFTCFDTGTPSEVFRIISENPVDIVLLDICLPGMDGLEILKRIKEDKPDTEVIMISGFGKVNNVIEAMRRGATDFFQKPLSLPEVQRAIMNTKRYHELNRKLKNIEMKYNTMVDRISHENNTILGKSPAFMKSLDLMKKVAMTDNTSVLITGESGTGKELIARGIHFLSQRREGLFCPVNCSAVSESLFESEFFGHIQGAFTGAVKTNHGLFEVADGGTLFLDEIGDLPYGMQPKLLRALEERKITMVGSHKETPVNVRVIAATNQEVEILIGQKKFREDLYYRLNTFSIHVPPLRERKEDIIMLFETFLNQFSASIKKKITRIDDDLYDLLLGYTYPGNIRELKNMVERAVILSENSEIRKEYFPAISGANGKNNHSPDWIPAGFDLDEAEKKIILNALSSTNNNKNQAARLLNISWQSLDRRLKKFNLMN